MKIFPKGLSGNILKNIHLCSFQSHRKKYILQKFKFMIVDKKKTFLKTIFGFIEVLGKISNVSGCVKKIFEKSFKNILKNYSLAALNVLKNIVQIHFCSIEVP